MITSVEDLDKMLARMIVAKHPERLEELGIDTEYIASLLRPTIELLRRDALAQIEKYHELLRINEERQRQIDTLKAEVFRKTVEMRKLQSRLDELQGKREKPKTVDKPQITSENSSLPPSKDPIGFRRTQSLRQKSERPNGGQPGHKGHTKEQTTLPNKTIECFPDVCPECGRRIDPAGAHIAERRQIWDLPLPIAPIVTEYQSMECTCFIWCQRSCSCRLYEHPPVHTVQAHGRYTQQCIRSADESGHCVEHTSAHAQKGGERDGCHTLRNRKSRSCGCR